MSDIGTIPAAMHPKVKTTVVLSLSAWAWLRRKAQDEAEKDGGRADASSVMEQLIREAASRT